MCELHLCPVSDSEVNEAFQVLKAVATWLENQGRRQRISHTRIESYRQWQAAGGNYAVMHGSQIAGIFSIVASPLLEWSNVDSSTDPTEPVTWLRALCTHPDHRRLKVGPFAIRSALKLTEHRRPLYLDCVSGFLPGYYSKHGFETIATQTKTYPDQTVFDLTLMRSK